MTTTEKLAEALRRIADRCPTDSSDYKVSSVGDIARNALRAALAATPAAEPPGDGPIADGWQLSIANGHSGYGVYAHMTDYPEEGAVFLLAATPAAAEPVGYFAAEIYAAWRKVGADVCGLKWEAFVDALRAGQGKESSK